VAVQISELEGLMIHQHENAVIRAKQGFEASLGHVELLGYQVGVLCAGWVEKDVESLDKAVLEAGGFGFGDGYGAARWPSLPAQPPHTVVADGGADCREDEVWWQARH
jgi:hypothetical protein